MKINIIHFDPFVEHPDSKAGHNKNEYFSATLICLQIIKNSYQNNGGRGN